MLCEAHGTISTIANLQADFSVFEQKEKIKFSCSICEDLAFGEGLRLGYLELFILFLHPRLLFIDMVRTVK